MADISLHLATEELAHLHEAVEYYFKRSFNRSKPKSEAARLYGRVIVKIEAAQERGHRIATEPPALEAMPEDDWPDSTVTFINDGSLSRTIVEEPPESPEPAAQPPAEAEPPIGRPGMPQETDVAYDVNNEGHSAECNQAHYEFATHCIVGCPVAVMSVTDSEWPQPGDKAVVIAGGEYHGMEVEIVKVYDTDTIQVKDAKDGVLLGASFPLRSLEIPEFVAQDAKGE